MKVKVARDNVMVRLVIGGNAVFITSEPIEIDESDAEAMAQVESMMKLGWLVKVEKEEKKGSSKKSSAKVEGEE
jgi:hypothetical protein